MINFGYLGGTLCWDSKPCLQFKFEDNILVSLNVIDINLCYKAFQFYEDIVEERTLRDFLEERLIPSTRQGLRERYLQIGIQYYHPEALTRYARARTCDDSFSLISDMDTRGLDGVLPKFHHLFIGD